MSFFEMLYMILIGPLQLVFEMIFAVANRMTGHPGIAIVVLSLIMNILVLPLYRRADIMQEEARDVELKLKDGVAHIKKCFSGDERIMMLQTYYRQNNYKPTDALNGSISLLLEVPFFIAAYQFLSHLEILQGVSLGPIVDLGAQDGLLVIGSLSINILPVAMTVINIISSALYLKGFPLKTKIQLYAMALFFLVFLYTSPSGLVFYWTLNNLFSLGKNIFYKIKNPAKVIRILLSVIGGVVLGMGLWNVGNITLKTKAVLLLAVLVLQMPLIISLLKEKNWMKQVAEISLENDKRLFILASVFLTVFIGILIPSAVISASPMEFIELDFFYNPIWYLVNSGCVAMGIFLVWMGVFYWLASKDGKAVFEQIIWSLCGIVAGNYMFFGTKLGLLFPNLQYENGVNWGFRSEVGNLVIVILIVIIMGILAKKIKKFIPTILLTVTLAVVCMIGKNVVTVNKAVMEVKVQMEIRENEQPHFYLSRTGKNVVVLMLDRAMSQYVPYIFNEKPDLQEKFAGFTYYANTISHGPFTNFTTPEVFGGYEYTPLESNKRSTETLVSKQNEALKVMPNIFDANGYEVTVCNPPYAGYAWIPDLSIYDDLPRVRTYNTQGSFNETGKIELDIEHRKRNFFCFALMKSMPLILQETLYDNGRYNEAAEGEERLYVSQVMESTWVATGINQSFLKQYNELENMDEMSRVVEEEKNTFLMLYNTITHEPMLLQTPEYEPALYVDNTEYYIENQDKFTINGRQMKLENNGQVTHYQVNMAALLCLGEWLDYLRENDVYDNTRIILVADHGVSTRQFDDFVMDEENGYKNLDYYYPLLMVKDFNNKDYQESKEFMTNADVPILAMDNLIDNPINPYTGKPIDNSSKNEEVQYITISNEWDTETNNGNVFSPSQWYRLDGDNALDKSNWTFLEQITSRPDVENVEE